MKFKVIISIFLIALITSIINFDKFLDLDDRNIKYLYIYFLFIFILLCTLTIYKTSKINIWYEKFIRNQLFLIIIFSSISFFMFEITTGSIFDITEFYVVILNITFISTFFIIVRFFTNNVLFIIIFTNTFLFILALAEFFVTTFRGRPIMIGDISSIKTALTVMPSYHFELPINVLTGFLIYCTLLIWSILINTKLKRNGNPFLTNGILLLIVCTFYFFAFSGELTKKSNLTINQWEQLISYQENGFFLSTAVLYDTTRIQKPDNYSKEGVKEIIREGSLNNIKADLEKPDNIILIMNESFGDLKNIKDFRTSEEVMPFIDSLKENVIKGNLYVSVFGGGTANTEYEFLTGNSVAFLPPSIIAYQNYINPNTKSFVKNFIDQGYTPIAYHPYVGKNYNRDVVYPNLGFIKYFTLDDYDGDMLRWWPTDSGTFSQIIKMYEEKESELFLNFTVTMQNHAPYDDSSFDNFIKLSDFPNEFPQTEQYLSLINKTDKAFEEVTNYFTKINEKTVIVMFGDHLPQIENEFYEFLYEKKMSELTNEKTIEMYKTPFIVWANYDIGYDYVEKISSNYFLSYIMSRFGFPISNYQNYLLELFNKLPVISSMGYYDKGDIFYSWDEESNYSNLLNDYKKVQYYNIFENEEF